MGSALYLWHMPVLDAHAHLFPPEIIRDRRTLAQRESAFSLIYGNERSPMVDYEGLAAYVAEQQIENVVCCSFPFRDPGLLSQCNDYILEAARRDTCIIPFVMVGLENGESALQEAERCLKLGARGIGEVAFYERGFGSCERERLHELAAYMEGEKLILQLHMNEQVGHTYKGKVEIDFQEVVRFIEMHPNLDTIFAHLGGGLCFYEFMPEIKKLFTRVYYDLAATPYLYSKEIYPYIERFLPDKVLFGSDFPLLSFNRYRTEMSAMGAEGREKVCYWNGRRLFGAP